MIVRVCIYIDDDDDINIIRFECMNVFILDWMYQCNTVNTGSEAYHYHYYHHINIIIIMIH